MSDSDKENFEIDIFKLKQKLGYIQKKIMHQQKVHTKELQNIEKITRKEVVEKLAEAHNEATVRQRKSFNKLLEDTHKLYEEKLETLETYYQAKLRQLKKKCDDTENNEDLIDTVNCQIKELLQKITNLQGHVNELINDKEKSEEQLLVCEKRLRDIQNVLTGSSDTAYINSEVQVKKDISVLKANNDQNDSKTIGLCNCSITPIKQEHSSMNVESKENKLEKACEEINDLKQKLQRETQIREQLAKEMMMTEYMANQSRREASDTINSLMEQNVKLKQDLENMDSRHKEQFQKYEKLVQRSREEIEVHKREVAGLRQHFVFGCNSPIPIPKPNEKSSLEKPKSANKSTNLDSDNFICRPRKLRSGKELGGC
ncbi:hypothetical protein CBL_14150 [Carabus blaptoides fortunei]